MNSSTSDINSTSQPLQVTELPAPTTQGSDVITTAKPELPDTGYLPLQDFMGIAHPEAEDKDKLQFIWNEVGKGRSREETLEAIKEIRYRLSPPDVGENYLHKLYSFVRLMGEARSIDREMKAYEEPKKMKCGKDTHAIKTT